MTAAATETLPGIFHPELALDEIEPSKTNPRKHFDETDLRELAQSIKDKGVIQPIVVRPHPKNGTNASFEIVAGERRWRGSKLAGLMTIPAIERRLDDKAVLEIQVIENLQRSDIHPLEEANGYRALLDKHKYTVDVIAEKVGKSKEYVYGRMKLSDLIPQIQARFLENEITPGHAILLARLPEESQVIAAKELFETEQLEDPATGENKQEKVAISVRDLRDFISRNIQMDLAKAPFDVADPDLFRQAGACIACLKRTGAEPQLWPEIGKRDLCGDRTCYHKKINAYIAQEVEAGTLIRLTSDYSKRSQKGMTYVDWNTATIKPGSKTCENAVIGIYIDGHNRGETLKICPTRSCKIHYGGLSNGGRRTLPTPAEQLKNATQSITANMDAELRLRMYTAIVDKIDLLGSDLAKLSKKQVLQLLLRLVYDRLDSSVRAKVTAELKLKKAQYGNSAHDKELDAYSAKLNPPEILALAIKLGLRNLSMNFRGGWNDHDNQCVKDLTEIAALYGVKVEPIKEEIAKLKKDKLGKAKARIESAKKSKKAKSQTSAKSKTTPTDDDLDDAGDLE